MGILNHQTNDTFIPDNPHLFICPAS